ncbi:MAG TPA: outer membrane protein assembly factor BamB [Burkholderiales bacterium]
MRRAWLAFVLASAAAAAGCGSAPVREPPAPLPEFAPSVRAAKIWSEDLGGKTKDYVGLVPRVRDGIVYAAGAGGRVGAFDAASGARLWQVELDLPIAGGVGLGDRLLAVGTRDGQVVALARDDGRTLWRSAVSSEVLAPPAIAPDIVVVQTVDGRVTGLAADDGARLWVYDRTEPALSLRGTNSPVIVEDIVFAGFGSGRLVALSLEQGAPLWEVPVAQPRGRNEIERLVDVDVPPLVLPDAIYAASYQGKLTAFNPRSGNIIWSRDVSTYSGIAADASNVYVTDEHGYVLAFDRRNGASVWRQEALRGRRLNAPAVHGDFVAVADYEGYVHWLARDDGRFIARARVDDAPVRAPAAVDGETLFVAAISGELAALRLMPR